MREQKLSARKFAEIVGASDRAVIKWCRRERIPRLENMQAIADATGGKVTALDFYSRDAA